MATVTTKINTNHPYWTIDEEAQRLAHQCQCYSKNSIEPVYCTVGSLNCPFQKYCAEITPSDWLNIIQR